MSTHYGGYMGKVLQIDLSTYSVSEYPWTDEDRELYLGGKIMAAKILYDHLAPDVKPLDADNWLVVSTGPLTGTGAPMSSRFNISTISPLTGLAASSNCGGDFGLSLKKAGYDALILSGKAENPTWVEIRDDQVFFHDASTLWGKTTFATQEELGPHTGKIVIGPAGENLVKYASVFNQERAAGRTGVGAVMGSKNLKAVTAIGTHKVILKDEEKARQIYKAWVKKLLAHPMTGDQLRRYGTAGLVKIMQRRRVLATRNFKYGQFRDYERVSGETLAKQHLIKNKGCPTCPIQCGRQVEVDGRKVKGPELETIGLLGPNIENNDLTAIIRWNLLLDELGMDTISTAGTVAFAMELNEKRLWDNGLVFGQTDNLADVFQDIAYRRGLGVELAEGVRYLSRKYGGQEFAMQSKGLELAAYEPRSAVGQGLGYAVANRGACHLNAGYPILFEGLGLAMDPYTPKGKAAVSILFQNLMEAASAGGSCLFSLYAALPAPLLRKPNSFLVRLINKSLPHTGAVLSRVNKARSRSYPLNLPMLPHARAIRYATGMKMDFGRFRWIGERGYTLERLLNLRRGLTAADDALPARLTTELQDPANPHSRVPLTVLKRDYYRDRGWSIEGLPTAKTLKRLKLSFEKM